MENINNLSNTENNNIKNISKNRIKRIVRNNSIYKYIKENPYKNLYQISNELKINYTTISDFIRDLEYCFLVASRIIIDSENRAQKIVFVPKENLNII